MEEEEELAESEALGSSGVIAESDAASGAAEPLRGEEEVRMPFLQCFLCFVSAGPISDQFLPQSLTLLLICDCLLILLTRVAHAEQKVVASI